MNKGEEMFWQLLEEAEKEKKRESMEIWRFTIPFIMGFIFATILTMWI